MKHVAVYCRESVDRTGRAENVADQEGWGREYAAAKWPDIPVLVFVDNDLSAAKDDYRPGYEALRAAVQRGEIAHLWCVEQTRLERREVEWFVLAAELYEAGITELHTNRDGVVRVQDEVAGIKAVLAAAEVRKLTRRVNDRLDAIAAQGRPSGSRPFGYRHAVTADGVKTYAIVPEQADAIRFAADKVLAGWSLTHVAEALRERGLHGAHRAKVRNAKGEVLLQDGRWVAPKHPDVATQAVTRPTELTDRSIRKMLTSPTVAGHRVHRGVDYGPGSGNWPAILDEATWKAVREKLTTPRTVQRSDGGTYPVGPAHTGYAGRRYLLTSGLTVCGACKAPLSGTAKQMGKKPGQPPKRVVAYLVCHPTMGGKGCVGIMLAETEKHVVDRLFAELDKPEFLAAITADDHEQQRRELGDRLDEIEQQRRELAALWATPGELTTAEWKAARAGLDAQEQQVRAALAAVPPPMVKIDISTARQAWPYMTLDEKREFIRLFVERVTIARATPGRKGFDGGRVSIEWRKGRSG